MAVGVIIKRMVVSNIIVNGSSSCAWTVLIDVNLVGGSFVGGSFISWPNTR